MLAKRWREHGDREAAHKLVTSHLRLVAKLAMGYRGYGLPISEVVSEGNVGLMQAVKRFEPEKGFRLATYAMWWIKAAIQEYILRSWSLVKMGTTANQKKLFFNLRKAKSKISALDEGDLASRSGQDHRQAPRRHRAGRHRHEPPPRRRRLAQRADPRGRRFGRMAGLAGRRFRQPGSRDGARRGTRQPPPGAVGSLVGPQRARAAHLRGAPPRRGSDHARGTRRRVQRLARARAPDRGARLREDAEGGDATASRRWKRRPPPPQMAMQ